MAKSGFQPETTKKRKTKQKKKQTDIVKQNTPLIPLLIMKAKRPFNFFHQNYETLKLTQTIQKKPHSTHRTSLSSQELLPQRNNRPLLSCDAANES
jgi:hypothetical protein